MVVNGDAVEVGESNISAVCHQVLVDVDVDDLSDGSLEISDDGGQKGGLDEGDDKRGDLGNLISSQGDVDVVGIDIETDLLGLDLRGISGGS